MSLIESHQFLTRFLGFFKEVPFESIFAAWGIVTVLWTIVPRLRGSLQRRSDAKYLHNRLGAAVFTPEDLLNSTRYYIQHDCQNIDPAGEETWRRDSPVRQPVFSKLDQLFSNPEYRHTILLADTGMGKTALLVNYYVRSRRKKSRSKSIAVIPLGHPKASQLIDAIDNKKNTVLMLDAFDEDTRVKDDHRIRLLELLEASWEFRHVLISCRTQFFRSDEEIPRETGVMRFGPTSAAQEHQYIFHKLYLSPFDEDHVDRYLRKRWPIWRWSFRKKARLICHQVGDLALRPLILTNLEALIGHDVSGDQAKRYKYSFEIYEGIIDAWITRESAYVDGKSLKILSERLATKIYSQREQLRSERLPFEQAMEVAQECKVTLQERQIRGHSLLNRDAEGRLKFAHRSIMEFLYVASFIAEPSKQPPWTDQMAKFYIEIALHDSRERKQRARIAAVHVDLNIRKKLIEQILEMQPSSLGDLPVSLGLVFLESVRDNMFLMVMIRSDQFLAISKRALPAEFVNSSREQFQTHFEIPIIGTKRAKAQVVPLAYREILEKSYLAAFGQPITASIWKGLYEPHKQAVGSLHIAYLLTLVESAVHFSTTAAT